MADDLLKNSATAFQALLDKEYLLELGNRKRTKTTFKIIFEKDDFKHLAGIKSLNDLPRIKAMPANLFFTEAIAERITDEHLKKSIKFNEIADRLEHLKNLEYYLDNNMIVYKWDKTKAYSRIVADYMLEEKTDISPRAYVFVKNYGTGTTLRISEIVNHQGVSFFRTDKKLSAGQVKYTLLKNEKMHKGTGTTELLFDFIANKEKK